MLFFKFVMVFIISVHFKDNNSIIYYHINSCTKIRKNAYNILNKSENATPELFAICIQNDANHECILMFKYTAMHNSKSFTDDVTGKHMEAIYM